MTVGTWFAHREHRFLSTPFEPRQSTEWREIWESDSLVSSTPIWQTNSNDNDNQKTARKTTKPCSALFGCQKGFRLFN